MSKPVLLLILALPGALQTQISAADFNLTVHVTASRIGAECGGNELQRITADVGSSTYEMADNRSIKGIMALRDYKAKLVQDKTLPTNEFTKTCELLFPDGSTRKFGVTGQLK